MILIMKIKIAFLALKPVAYLMRIRKKLKDRDNDVHDFFRTRLSFLPARWRDKDYVGEYQYKYQDKSYFIDLCRIIDDVIDYEIRGDNVSDIYLQISPYLVNKFIESRIIKRPENCSEQAINKIITLRNDALGK